MSILLRGLVDGWLGLLSLGGMLESRIVAVDHVNLEAPLGVAEEVRWFYGEVCGLDEVDLHDAACLVDVPTRLVFKSARIELRVCLVEHPKVEPVDCRVAILVTALEEAMGLLDEGRVPYDTLTGLRGTDRMISLIEPGGNRVELRQYWPRITV